MKQDNIDVSFTLEDFRFIYRFRSLKSQTSDIRRVNSPKIVLFILIILIGFSDL